WFIPNTVLSPHAPCNGACDANETLISGGQVTAFGQNRIGQQISLKTQDPHNSLSPGDFYAIDFPGSQGANDYKDNIATCANAYVRCSDSYSVKNGNMVGPTKQGVDALIGNPPNDTWVSIGQYQTSNGLSDTSKAVVLSPIWDSCGTSGFCPAGKFPGN